MNSGTQAAKEAGNMVDLDSNPTKLIEIVETGKQMLMTRGALTTFSLANDLAKYFAIVPAAFASTYPQLGALNIMGLSSPDNAILSAVIFNALIIVALIPLALKGVAYRPQNAETLLRNNLLVYGGGGVIVPFIGIKLIEPGLECAGLSGVCRKRPFSLPLKSAYSGLQFNRIRNAYPTVLIDLIEKVGCASRTLFKAFRPCRSALTVREIKDKQRSHQ